jgi:hypothetical protein
MIARVLERLRTPGWALALLGWLTGLVVQSGSFGTVDTWRRYQVTRSLWRGVPPVAPGDLGLRGVDGSLQAWYGIGQSLVMAPGDLLAGAIVKAFGVGPAYAAKLEMAVVAFVTFPLVTALNAFLAFRVLRDIGDFGVRTAVLGVIVWLFGTTVLHYAQVSQENSLDLLLSLLVALGSFAWVRQGSRAKLFVAGTAALFGAQVRVTTLVDHHVILAAALAAPLLGAERPGAPWLRARVLDVLRIWLPLVVLALFLDRAYQVARFGWDAVGTTYIHMWGAAERAKNPALPASYPFSGSFAEGFLGPLVNVNRSVFLFDPLALPTLALFALGVARRRFPAVLVAFMAACCVSFLLRLLAYSRYAHWEAGTSWSSRFVLTPVQLWTLLAAPVFLSLTSSLPRAVRLAAPVVLAFSILLQLSSVLCEPNLEIIQAAQCGHEMRLVPDRAKNVVRELLRVDDLALSCNGRIDDDYLRLALLPFGNGKDLPARAWPFVLGAWLVLVTLFAGALVNALVSAFRSENGPLPSPRLPA